jgi:hypothetical protein
MSNLATVIPIKQGKKNMPSKNGYVTLWRDINNQAWANEALSYAVFCKLMTLVQHKPYVVEISGVKVALQAGEYAMSYSDVVALFKDIKDKSHARRIIEKFTSLRQLTKREVKKGNVNYGFIIGFSCWEKWQNIDTPTDTPTDTPEPAKIKVLEVVRDTPTDTPTDTQRNNNDLNNNKRIVSKDTCQNSDEFLPAEVQKIPYQEIVELFATCLPTLPQPKKLTDARRKAIKARHTNDLKSKVENWERYFNYIRENCSWMVSGEYNIDFDYVIKQSNFIKILEGAKNDRG